MKKYRFVGYGLAIISLSLVSFRPISAQAAKSASEKSPGPHTKEMLIVYLPKEKLVFQGDLLNLPQAGTTMITPGNETTVHFADRLKGLGLAVEKIAAVHGRTGTMDDLRVAIEKFRALK
jgi:hypothetical protein